MAYTITSWDGHTLNGASGLEAKFASDAPWERGVTINETRRRNYQSGVDSINREPWQFEIGVNRTGATLTYAQALTNIQQWFTPWKTATRQLVATAEDGSTSVYLDCYVVSYRRVVDTGNGNPMWRVVLRSVVPWWQSVTLHSPTSTPVSNAGTTRVYPQLTLANGGATALYRVNTVLDNTGRGLVGYPVLIGSLGTIGGVLYTFVNGVSVPNLISGSNAWCRVDCVPGGTSTVVTFYGAALPANPIQGTLNLGSLSASSSNTVHTHNAFAVSTYPQANATWQPTIFTIVSGGPSSSGFDMVDGSSSVAFTLANPASGNKNDANAMVMQVGTQTGTANAIAAGLSRVTALHSGVRSFVRGRVAGSVSWFDAWTQTGNATVTTTIDIDSAVEIAAGIEYTTTGGTDGASLTLSGSHAITLASTPTVTLGTQKTVRIYDGTFTNSTTGQTLTFTTYCFPDGTLTWDFNADPNQRGLTNSNTDTACVLGSALPTSDPIEGLALDPGSNTVATTISTTPTWTLNYRDGFV